MSWIASELKSEFVAGVNYGLRFGAIIVEDSITGYSQANHYAGGVNGPMCGLELLPSTIPGSQMNYNHVARKIMDTPFGTQGSIPLNNLPGSISTHRYSLNVPSNWNYNHLSIVGFLREESTGEILNATNVVRTIVGIEEHTSENPLKIYPNPIQNTLNIKTAPSMLGAKYSVHNVFGSLILNGEISSETTTIDIGNIPRGLYLLTVDNGAKQTFKIVKQ